LGFAWFSGFSWFQEIYTFAAQLAATDAARRAKEVGLMSVDVLSKVRAQDVNPRFRALVAAGCNVTSIKDVTPISS